MQRALHASERLVESWTDTAAAWRLLANCQLDLAKDEEARVSIERMLHCPDFGADDKSWAEARLGEISARLQGKAPSLAEQTLASIGPSSESPSSEATKEKTSPAPAASAGAGASAGAAGAGASAGAAGVSARPSASASPAKPAGASSGGDIPSPLEMGVASDEPSPAPEKGRLSSTLERQGIITVVSSRDNEQLLEVKKLLDADPNNLDLLDWYAFACYTSEYIDEAIKTYERLIKEGSPTDKTYYYLASAYLKKPDVRMAFKYFNLLKKSFPNSKLIEKVEEKKGKLAALAKV